jgi:BEN domain
MTEFSFLKRIEDSFVQQSAELTPQQQLALKLIPKDIKYDARFVNYLLKTLFGESTLANSSVTGFSKSGAGEKLDPGKLSVIQGTII